MIILFVIALIVIIIWLNVLYKHTNHYKEGLSDVLKFKKPISQNVEIAVIGSNHPKYAFDFQETDIRGVNWAIGPEAFEYDYVILKKNVSKLADGATVVMPICLFSFFLYRFDNTNTYLKYYHILNKEEFPHYSVLGKVKSIFPLLFYPKLIRYIFKDIQPSNSLFVGYNPKGTEEELNKDADNWIRGWEKQFNISLNEISLSDKNKCDIQENIQILKDMIEFCLSKKLKPVIAILPVTNYLYSKFTSEFVEKHILAYIVEANEAKVPVKNYLTDERFTDSSLYINSFFFNTRGRKKFTKQFVEDLRAQSIL